MDNPLPTFSMIWMYLAWVLVIGPTYMRDRKPLQLTTTLFYYNAFQVALSAYMFYEVSDHWVLGANWDSWENGIFFFICST